MTKISELFHQVGNWHNKISVAAGFTKAELKKRFKGTVIPEEIKNVLARLSFLEKQAVEASNVLHQLKVLVSRRIDADITRPKKRRKVK